jgi:hypothetical protein
VSASAVPSLSLVWLAAMLALSLSLLVAPLSLSLTAQAQPVNSTRTVFATDFQRVEGLALDANGNLYIADYVSWGVETAQRSAAQRLASGIDLRPFSPTHSDPNRWTALVCDCHPQLNGDTYKITPAGPSSPYACMRLAVALRCAALRCAAPAASRLRTRAPSLPLLADGHTRASLSVAEHRVGRMSDGMQLQSPLHWAESEPSRAEPSRSDRIARIRRTHCQCSLWRCAALRCGENVRRQERKRGSLTMLRVWPSIWQATSTLLQAKLNCSKPIQAVRAHAITRHAMAVMPAG